MRKSPPGGYETEQVILAGCMGRVSNVRTKNAVPTIPTSKSVSLLPGEGPPGVLQSLSEEGLNLGCPDPGREWRDPHSPTSVPGFHSGCLLCCQGQPGDLAGPGCNPVVWHLGHCLGRQPG